jgi:DNA polymerase III epsilon subunit-like protein
MSSNPTLLQAAAPSSSVDETTPKKKDKGRLKKLKKRVFQQQFELERCGILTRVDWMDYQRLEQDLTSMSSVGPAIRLRQKLNMDTSTSVNQKVEGAQHRDLLANLLHEHNPSMPQMKSKKRSRSALDDPIQDATMPSWVSFHNPGALQQVVVLELHVPHVDTFFSELASALQTSTTSCVTLGTNWFQGPIPRSISESLLYFMSSRIKRTSDAEQKNPTRETILEELQQFTLTKEHFKSEGYPRPCTVTANNDGNEAIFDSAYTTIQQPAAFVLTDAKAAVEKLGFRVENQQDKDDQLYVNTQPSTTQSTQSLLRVFGVDCEMVRTSIGSELARVTLVEFLEFQQDKVTTKTILDVLVKPYNPIKDYVTQHSGMSAKLMENVSTRLEQVQAALITFLRSHDILIGHSIENDLHACHYMHPNVIDTALLFRPDNKRCKFSLRHLTSALLQRTIQTGSHCSEQDAVATLELAVRRAVEGDTFGIANENRISLFDSLPKQSKAVCIGPGPWIQSHVTNQANGVHALSCESIVECRKAMLAWMTGNRKANLLWSLLNIRHSEESLQALRGLLVSAR